MNELNDEIKLTLNLMQTDIDDGAHGELQNHLYSLLEMKRDEISKRFALDSNGEDTETDTWRCYLSGIDLSGFVFNEDAKPLPAEDLKAGGWCFDEVNCQSLIRLFREYGPDLRGFKQAHRNGVAAGAKPLTTEELKAGGWWCADVSEVCRLALVEKGLDPWSKPWSGGTEFASCYLAGTIVLRSTTVMGGLKQLHPIGNEFYWSEV